MRGPDVTQEGLSTVAKLEDFVPADHPLRPIQRMVNEALKGLDELFSQIYADAGRSSIAPEKLIRALLLQVLYSIRSERMLVEQLHYNLLFRWFVGLAIDDAVWDHSSFSKNRDRLLEHAVVEGLFAQVMALAEQHRLLSDEHFSVDGTLMQAWASHKSFKPKDETPPQDPRPDAMPSPTGRVRRAATTPTAPPPIPRRACTERASRPSRSCATRGTLSTAYVSSRYFTPSVRSAFLPSLCRCGA